MGARARYTLPYIVISLILPLHCVVSLHSKTSTEFHGFSYALYCIHPCWLMTHSCNLHKMVCGLYVACNGLPIHGYIHNIVTLATRCDRCMNMLVTYLLNNAHHMHMSTVPICPPKCSNSNSGPVNRQICVVYLVVSNAFYEQKIVNFNSIIIMLFITYILQGTLTHNTRC